MNATQPAEEKTGETTRRVRRILTVLVAVASIVVIIGGAVRYLIERAVRVDQVEAAASLALGRTVRARAIEVSAIYGLVMKDVAILDTPASSDHAYSANSASSAPLVAASDSLIPLLTAATIRVRPSWWQLLQGRFEVASIRVIDGTLIARREPVISGDRSTNAEEASTWNVVRLATELSARPGPPGPKPFLQANNLAIQFAATGQPYDGWRAVVRKMTFNPEKQSGEATIDRFNDASTLLSARIKYATKLELAVEFENFPEAISLLLPEAARSDSQNSVLRYSGLRGHVDAVWTSKTSGDPSSGIDTSGGNSSNASARQAGTQQAGGGTLTIDGSLDGKSLSVQMPGKGSVRMDEFSMKSFSARCNTASLEWSAEIDGWKIGTRDAAKPFPLRIGALFSGAGGTARGKIEWEGQIESLLAMLPASTVTDAAKFKPRGGSAGHAFVNSKDGATEISITARGISVRLPDGVRSGDKIILPKDAELGEIRGRIGLAGQSVMFDSLTVHYQGDPVTVSGAMKNFSSASLDEPPASTAADSARRNTGRIAPARATRRDTALTYDLALSTPGFSVAGVGGFLPPEISLDGKVAAVLRLTPKTFSGSVRFLGNNLAVKLPAAAATATSANGDAASVAPVPPSAESLLPPLSGAPDKSVPDKSAPDKPVSGKPVPSTEASQDAAPTGEARVLRIRLTGGSVGLNGNDALTLDHVEAEVGAGTLAATGELRNLSHEPRMRIRLELQNADMKALSEAARVPLEFSGARVRSGTIDGTIAMDGPMKSPVFEGGIVLHKATAEFSGVILTDIEGPVKFDSSTFRTPGLTARARGAGSSGTGLTGGGVRIVGYHTPQESKMAVTLSDADAAILTPAVATVYPEVKLSGPVDAELTVSIRKNIPNAEGTLTFKGTEITGKDDLSIKNLTGSIELHSDRVTTNKLSAVYLGSPASFDGSIPRVDTGRFSLDVVIGKARLDHFAKFAPEGFVTTGTAENINVRVEGTRTAPRATGSVKFTGTTVKTPFLVATLADVRGDADFSPDSFLTHGLTFRTMSPGTNQPEANGSTIEVRGGIDHFDEPIFRQVLLKADDARLEDLLNLLPDAVKPLPKGAILTGTMKIDEVTIDGPMENAKWNGVITLKNGAGELPGLKRGVTGIEGSLRFGDGKAKAEGLKGAIGSTDVRIEGEMDLAKPYALKVKLSIKDADIAELYGAIPGSDAKGIDFKGRATMTATINYVNNKLKLDGTFLQADAEGFGMPFTEMEGSYRYDSENDVLALSNLNATWAGGRATDGAIKINLKDSTPAFDARGTVEGVKLEEVLKLSGFQSGGYSGLIDGSMAASGKFGQKQSVNGSGSFVIKQAKFEKLAALDAISRALRLDFFTKSTYESAKGAFTIEKGVVKTAEPDHFRLMGSSFTIELRGYTSLEGDCAYNFACGMQAGLVGNVLTRLQLGKLFDVSGDGGIIRASGTISGKIANPVVKTDLGILNLFN